MEFTHADIKNLANQVTNMIDLDPPARTPTSLLLALRAAGVSEDATVAARAARNDRIEWTIWAVDATCFYEARGATSEAGEPLTGNLRVFPLSHIIGAEFSDFADWEQANNLRVYGTWTFTDRRGAQIVMTTDLADYSAMEAAEKIVETVKAALRQ